MPDHKHLVEVMEKPLPPPPPHFNRPVGPPPAEPPIPTTYAGFVKAALEARGNPNGTFVHLWVGLAQASQQKRVADALEALVIFLGVNDRSEDPEQPEPRIADSVADGIISAVLQLKDEVLDLLPDDAREQFVKQLIDSVSGKKAKK